MEIWKDIPGYEGLYCISSLGRVRSLFTGKIRADVQAGHGYRAIQLSDRYHIKRRHYVHRLVAAAFLGKPPQENAEINHINCDKSDNAVSNLEWTTRQENMKHAYHSGKTDYRRPLRRDNQTGYKGICEHDGGYEVSFCGRYIGWFKSLDRAIEARKEAEENYEKAILGH